MRRTSARYPRSGHNINAVIGDNVFDHSFHDVRGYTRRLRCAKIFNGELATNSSKTASTQTAGTTNLVFTCAAILTWLVRTMNDFVLTQDAVEIVRATALTCYATAIVTTLVFDAVDFWQVTQRW